MTTPWIQTYTGRKVDLLAPLPGQFDPVDITWHLAHLCRFTGATHRFYSVAEHSVLVCQHVMQLTNDPDTHRAALLHDGTEAYLGDVSRPLKKLLPTYMGIEHAFEEIITRRFALKWHDREKIKTVDLRMLATEQHQLLSDPPFPWDSPLPPYPEVIQGLAPDDARALFAHWYEVLFQERLVFLS